MSSCADASKYINIYQSNDLNRINNSTRSTGMHTIHTTDIYPSTNMATTLDIYVLLHCYCTLHIVHI